jgi:hypothetical protein
MKGRKMVEFYIVKNKKEEAIYYSDIDIPLCDLNAVRKQIEYCISQNKSSKLDDWYSLKIQATNHKEIINCFYSAAGAGGFSSKIKEYNILESIYFKEENL